MLKAFFLLFSLTIPATSQIPRIEITPSDPIVGDSVEMWYVKCMHGNLVKLQYDSLGYEMIASSLAVNPSRYTIIIWYKEIVLPGEGGSEFKEYGPVYKFPNMAAGIYTIIDGEDSVGVFQVYESRYIIGGTVHDDPYPEPRAPKKIPGATVYLSKNPAFPLLRIDSATSNDTGYFELEPVVPGSYWLTFVADGYIQRSINFTFRKDTTVNAFLLPLGAMGHVSGNVFGIEEVPGGGTIIKPLAGCTVEVEYTFPIEHLLYEGVSDSNGSYFVNNIPIWENSQPVVVFAGKSGYSAAIDSSHTISSNTITQIDLYMTKQGVNAIHPQRHNPSENGRRCQVNYIAPNFHITLNIRLAQHVIVEGIMPNGAKIHQLSTEAFLNPGTSCFMFSSSGLSNCLFFLMVKGQDFLEIKRFILAR
jgi:hypothetical protein